MYLGATYPGSVGGAVALPTVGQGFVSLVLGATGVGSSKKKGTGATTPLALAIVGVGKSVRKGVGLAALQLSATGVGEKIEEASAEGFAPLFLVAEGLGAGEGEYYGEARPDETLTPGDWVPLNIASLEQAVNDSNDGTYAQSQVVGTTRTIELLEGSTVRAIRTIESGGGVWVEEEFLLSGVEKASITAWSDIRIRITDGGTPVVYGFPALITPPSNVEIYVRTRLEALVNGYSLKTSLVGFWELEEAANTTRYDSHGVTHLDEVNDAGAGTGKVGNCADFEYADNSRLLASAPTALSTGDIDYTIAMWVKLESKPSSQNMALAAKADLLFADADFWLFHAGTTDRFVFEVFATSSHGGGVTVTANTLGAPSLATWYFIVAWHDSVANTINIQVNNGTVDSVSHSGGIFDSGGEFFLGNNEVGYKYDGLMDQVGVWKRVLSAHERTWLYNLGAGRAYSELGPAVQGADLLEDLISLWELNEPSGTRYDAHGTNHLTDNNTVLSAAGKVGTAADFENSLSQYLYIADNAALSMGLGQSFTACAWVKAESLAAMVFLGKDSAPSADIEWMLYMTSSAKFKFETYAAAGGTADAAIQSTLTATNGVWYFVVVWYDAIATTLNLQINNGTADSSATGVTGVWDGTGTFQIGRGSGTYWDGLIDQVGFWKRVLTAAEKTWLYNDGNGRAYAEISGITTLTDLVACWEFDTSGNLGKDSHGAIDMTNVDAVTAVAGKVGNALDVEYDSVGHLSVADPPFTYIGDGDWTVMAWVKLESTAHPYTIISKGDLVDPEWRLGFTSVGNKFLLEVYSTTGGFGWTSKTSTVTLSVGFWYLVLAWHDADAGTINIQIDNNAPESVAHSGGAHNGDSPITIGTDAAVRRWDGLIDQVAIWARKLSPDERRWLYNAGAGRAYSELGALLT